MNFSNSLQNIRQILEEVKQNPTVPFYKPQAFAPDFLTWTDLERTINRPHGTTIECIDSQGGKLDGQTPLSVIKQHIVKGNSFAIVTGDDINQEMNQLCDMVEKVTGLWCETHIYGGLRSESRSFGIHADPPMNLILQMSGDCKWTVFQQVAFKPGGADESQVTKAFDVLMKPGDLIYVPALMYHWCQPLAKRFSISIPIRQRNPEHQRREWIKL
jgi:hypothetical protein